MYSDTTGGGTAVVSNLLSVPSALPRPATSCGPGHGTADAPAHPSSTRISSYQTSSLPWSAASSQRTLLASVDEVPLPGSGGSIFVGSHSRGVQQLPILEDTEPPSASPVLGLSLVSGFPSPGEGAPCSSIAREAERSAADAGLATRGRESCLDGALARHPMTEAPALLGGADTPMALEPRWHELTAAAFLDPVTRRKVRLHVRACVDQCQNSRGAVCVPI